MLLIGLLRFFELAAKAGSEMLATHRMLLWARASSCMAPFWAGQR